MTPAYQTLLTYAQQLTGNASQARKIVDHVLLESARVLVETGDEKEASAFVVAEIRRLCYEYNTKKHNNMKTVYKYRLPDKVNQIMIPEGGVVLTVQLQDDLPTIWVLVDPGSPPVERIFCLVGTGQKIENNQLVQPVYVGTIQIEWEVWHCFETFK